MMRVKKGEALLLGLGLVAGALVGEALSRNLGLSKTWLLREAGRVRVSDGVSLAHRYRPQARWRGAYGMAYTSNALGFREREIDAMPALGVTRVAVLGDSVTEGLGVLSGERFTERLQRRLGTGFEVLNFGISGYSTRDAEKALARDVLPLAPALVVLQFCFNDVSENLAAERSVASAPAASPAPATAGVKPWLQRHSALYLVLAERYGAWRLSRGEPNSLLRRILATRDDDLAATGAALAGFVGEARRAGVPVLVVYVPQEPEARIADPKLAAWFGERLKPLVEATGARFVNVTDELRRAPCVRFLDDCHLTRCGHDAVGDALAPAVAALLEAAQPVGLRATR